MKKTLALLAALAFAAPAIAQTKLAPVAPGQNRPTQTLEERADRQAQALTKQLGLSADQATQVAGILKSQLQESAALRQKYQAADSRQGAGQELKATKAKYDEQLKAVLTPEQFSKLEQIRAERVQKMRDRRRG